MAFKNQLVTFHIDGSNKTQSTTVSFKGRQINSPCCCINGINVSYENGNSDYKRALNMCSPSLGKFTYSGSSKTVSATLTLEADFSDSDKNHMSGYVVILVMGDVFVSGGRSGR